MANLFVRSTDGSDVDDGSTWALAKATLAGALAVAAAGDTIFVADAHAETQASAMTLTSPGTPTSPVRILCVDDTGDPANPTTLATTGTVSTTGVNNISFDTGVAYVYGLTFTAGDGANNGNVNFTATTADWAWKLEACKVKLGGSSTNSRINVGASNTNFRGILILDNTTVEFANTAQGITLGNIARFEWMNTPSAIAGATFPTSLFKGASSNSAPTMFVRGVDLSALGSNSLVDVATGSPAGKLAFSRCKLGASFSLFTGTFAKATLELIFDNCDSGDTNYKMARRYHNGSVDQETVIVRSGGASDGTTPISWKMAINTIANTFFPLYSPFIPIWNDTTGLSKTVTAEVVTDNVTLTDKEAWLELEYLGTSGFPRGVWIKDFAADTLATAANQTSSSVTWDTTGLGTPVKQKLAVTFTPQEKGLYRARVALAKASTTMYLCPKLEVT